MKLNKIKVNNNGRIYSNKTIGEMINQYEDNKNKYGVFYGELGHPDSVDIALSKISHTIENVYVEDDELYFDIKLLNTPNGNDLKNLSDAGVKFDIEPRYSGRRNEDGSIDNFKLYSFDIVNIKQDDEMDDPDFDRFEKWDDD